MKKIILFCLLLFIESFPQYGYTVELKKTYSEWLSKENWSTKVEAVIKYNGNTIPNDSNYYYEYHLNTFGSWTIHSGSGFGNNTDESDAYTNQIQYWYVIVTDSVNHTFSGITSNTVSFQMETTNTKATQVVFKAKKSDGSSLSSVNAEHWMYPVGLWTSNYSGFLTVNQDEILKLTEKMFMQMIEELWPQKRMAFDKWPRLDWQDVMGKYGTDKPDLRKDKNNSDELAFAWIINFPLFKKQVEDKKSEEYFHGSGGKWAPSHNMFTRPKEEDLLLLESDPGKVKSYQHDLVLNGVEVGGGALRIYDAQVQEKVFDLIGFDEKQKQQFKHMLEAFSYGVPPHGGIAPGFDRLLAILQGEKSIREVIAFPLTSDAKDLLMDSPSEVSKEQLDELGIGISDGIIK